MKRMNAVERFKFVSEIAKSRDEVSSNHDRVMFDYFNPNGAWNVHMEAFKVATSLVAEGLVRVGTLYAYDGTLYRKHIEKLARRKSPPTTFESRYYGDALRKETEKLREAVFMQCGKEI